MVNNTYGVACYRVCSLGAAPYTIQNVCIVKVSETSMINAAGFVFFLLSSVSPKVVESLTSLRRPGSHHDATRFPFGSNKTPALLKVVKRSRDISGINNSAPGSRPQPSSCLHLLARQMRPSSSEPSPRHLRTSSSLVALFFPF